MTQPVQTIELTSKSVKLWLLITGVALILGIVGMLTCYSVGNSDSAGGWGSFTILALLANAIVRVVRWWKNG